MTPVIEREWPLTVVITEDDDTTRADVVLDVGPHHFHCWGRALRSRDDDLQSGGQVAAARALASLANELLAATGEQISAV